jgi:hypothetical protein
MVKEPTIGKTIIVRPSHFGDTVNSVRINPELAFDTEEQRRGDRSATIAPREISATSEPIRANFPPA